MQIRKTLIGLAMLAAGASAQGPGRGPGPGHGDRMGFGPAGPGARFLGAEAGMSGRVVKNAPYAADIVTESTQTLADGNHIRQSTTGKVYRDSEGRTRSEQSVNLNGLAANANMPPMVFINDPVAGLNYALNTKDRTAVKSNWMPRGRGGPGGPPPNQTQANGTQANGAQADGARVAQRRQRGASDPNRNPNVRTESLGRQTIEGVQADGRRTTVTIPVGQMGNELPIQSVTEVWYSAELHTEVLYKHSDPRMGDIVRKLANVSRGEPSRTMFEAPADYKVTESAGRMQHGGPGPGAAK
jgi:hypothetical protein